MKVSTVKYSDIAPMPWDDDPEKIDDEVISKIYDVLINELYVVPNNIADIIYSRQEDGQFVSINVVFNIDGPITDLNPDWKPDTKFDINDRRLAQGKTLWESGNMDALCPYYDTSKNCHSDLVGQEIHTIDEAYIYFLMHYITYNSSEGIKLIDVSQEELDYINSEDFSKLDTKEQIAKLEEMNHRYLKD